MHILAGVYLRESLDRPLYFVNSAKLGGQVHFLPMFIGAKQVRTLKKSEKKS